MRLFVFGAVVLALTLSQTAFAAQSSAHGLTATAQLTPQPSAVVTVVASKTEKPATVASSAVSGTSAAQDAIPHRTPALATLFAWFPGIVIHGAGHMYAGSWMKGVGLFLLEGASAYLIYEPIHEYSRGAYNNIQGVSSSGISSLSNLSPELQPVGIGLVALTGFIFTWVDDIGGASIAADQFNTLKQQEAAQLSLNFEPTPGGAQLALSTSF